MKQTRSVNLRVLTCFTHFIENNTMGRARVNLVYEYFVYDKEKNTSQCTVCDRKFKGHHGTNLLHHLSSRHPAEHSEVVRKNLENKGGVYLDASYGTKILGTMIENCNDTSSPKNLKEEANDTESEEYESADPLLSYDDDEEPPQKRERRSRQIELAQPSSSRTPNEKIIKKNKVTTQADKFDLLGNTVALKLRGIAAADDKQRLMAEKIINDALFYAEMGQLTLAYCNRMNLEQ